jgi:hypothetical protein
MLDVVEAECIVRRDRRGRFHKSATGDVYRATWRRPTMADWSYVEARTAVERDVPGREERLWRRLLVAASFLPRLGRDEQGLLDAATWARILDFRPAWILTVLAEPVWRAVRLTPEEEAHITRNVQSLWSHTGGSVRNPHPLLSEVLTAMRLHKDYGIAYTPELGRMDQRLFAAFDLVARVKNEVEAANAEAEKNKELARRGAGVRTV